MPGLSRINAAGWVAMTLASAALAVMLGRVVQLQMKPPERLAATAGTRVAVQREEAVRGDIMDRRGRLLSVTRFGYRVIVDPTLMEPAKLAAMRKPVPFERIVVELARATGRPPGVVGMELVDALRENEIRRAVLAAINPDESAPTAPEMDDEERPTPPEHVLGSGGEGANEPIRPEDILPADQPWPAQPKRPSRYLPMSGVLTDEQVAMFESLDLPGVTLERVPVREYPGGATVAAIVGKLGTDMNGTVGAERMLADRLDGREGQVRFVRDASGRPLWIRPGDVSPAAHGEDIRLSIDLEIQRIVSEELLRGVNDYNAAGGRAVVLDPASGEILAMVDLLRPVPDAVDYPYVPIDSRSSPGAPEYVPDRRYKVLAEDPGREKHPALGKNRCVEAVYEPGSTFKPFVWSVVTELEKMTPSTVVDTEYGEWTTSYGRTIRDVKKLAQQTWTDVLINSSNVGMGKGAEKLSFRQLHDAVVRFGFGSRTGIGLPGEAKGLVTNLSSWRITSQHSVAFGNEVAVTPLQMARAFTVFARQGDAAGTMPPIRILAASEDEVRGDVLYRVIPPKVAMLARDALGFVAGNMESSLSRSSPGEKEWRYAMFGKSGTSKIPVPRPPAGMRIPRGTKAYIDKQYISSFIAAGPTESPRIVVLITIDDPGPELTRTSRAYGSLTAGPVCRRVMERTLTYLGVPPSPGSVTAAAAAARAKPVGPVEDVLIPADPPADEDSENLAMPDEEVDG